MTSELKNVDHAGLRSNQATIIVLLLVAFIFNQTWLALVTSLVMLTGTALGRLGFGFLYSELLKPRGWMKPDVLPDHPEPHRFAQGFGGVVLIGALALILGASVVGWALTWLVIALAALNLFAGFAQGARCITGCTG